ncbi:MAG TPA: DUF4386 family protein [Chloroflexota bacterium]|nr:DUF4386 family protein [Chloroflexota bacterium]
MDTRLQRLGGIAALSGFGAVAFQLFLYFVYIPSLGFSINDMNGDVQTRLRLLNAARTAFLWDGLILFAFFSFQFVLVHALYVRLRDSAPVLSLLAAVFGYGSTALLVLEQVRVYTLAKTVGKLISADQMTYVSPNTDFLRGMLENGSLLLNIPWIALVCIASLRNRELTRPVAYLGILAAAWNVLIAVGVLPGGAGPNPPGTLLVIAVGVVLLVRPDPRRTRAVRPVAEPTTA